jgi:hypothetical protein
VATRTDRSKTPCSSLPSVVFALAFILLGWVAGHSIAYAIVGLVPHGHEQHMHGYMEALKLAGSFGFVLAFGLALRAFFKHGSFGEWLHGGGIAGTRRQILLATVLPAGVFVGIEYLERMVAGTGTLPSAGLLAVGVFVQLIVGLLCLGLVRITFRVAERVIVAMSRRRFVRPDLPTSATVLESVTFVSLLCPMAGSKSGRPPPISAVSF